MPRTVSLLLAVSTLLAGCTTAGPAARSVSHDTVNHTSTMPCVWTGREVVVWDGRVAQALDPQANTWRRLPADPRPGQVTCEPRLLALRNGLILVAYVVGNGAQQQTCFDTLDPGTGAWQQGPTMPRSEIIAATGKGDMSELRLHIDGLAEVSDGVLALLSINYGSSCVVGAKITGGSIRLLPTENAPPHGGEDTAIAVKDDRVLYWCYATVFQNQWSVWDDRAGRWQKPQESERAYSFGHCSHGDDVYVFGGAESSAFGWLKNSFWHYSFGDNSWRRIEVPADTPARRDFAMVWTGNQVLVWGGAAGEAGSTEMDASNSGAAWSPATGAWTPLPSAGAPPPRMAPLYVWTGRELIVWSGFCIEDTDCYAYDPIRQAWRRMNASLAQP